MSSDFADRPSNLEPEGFLERWSRRKSEADAPHGAPAAAATEPAPAAPEVEAEPPGDEDMEPVESLNEDSDYAPFLSPRVSAELQRLALRKLFGLPGFNVRDGLDDYDEDFTHFAPLGNVITADIRHRLELAAQRRAAAEREAAADGGNEAGTEPVDDAPPAGAYAASPGQPQQRTTRSSGDDPDDPQPDEELDA